MKLTAGPVLRCADRVQVITTLNTGKLFYCGVFHPDDGKQNVLMSGCGDKKIYQFDLNTGDVEQVGMVI
jgi:pre-mRNA-processing factor 17